MDLATAWYYRYIEKEEQIEKIEKNLIQFENFLCEKMNDGVISVAELQKAWHKTIKL
jgi:hypothetical protein